MEKKLWQKVATAALAVALAVVPAVGLVGCGGNPADQVKSVVTSNFDQIKSLDAEAIDELGSMDELKELETTYGISSERLIKAFYGHFDYTVDSVEVDGDTATVKITSSNVDLQKVVESYMDSLTEFATSDEAQNLVTEGGQQAVQDKVVELLMAAFEAEDVPIATGQTDLARGACGQLLDLCQRGRGPAGALWRSGPPERHEPVLLIPAGVSRTG